MASFTPSCVRMAPSSTRSISSVICGSTWTVLERRTSIPSMNTSTRTLNPRKPRLVMCKDASLVLTLRSRRIIFEKSRVGSPSVWVNDYFIYCVCMYCMFLLYIYMPFYLLLYDLFLVFLFSFLFGFVDILFLLFYGERECHHKSLNFLFSYDLSSHLSCNI